MEHISKNLSKYSKNKHQLVELDKIRAEIFKSTGINPVSLKIKNNTLVIKVYNQYQALELQKETKEKLNLNKNISAIKVII